MSIYVTYRIGPERQTTRETINFNTYKEVVDFLITELDKVRNSSEPEIFRIIEIVREGE